MSVTRGKADEGRLGFIDDARGLAVVLMIFWHTVDGWIRPSLQADNPRVLEVMRLFGGTAAPMFVTLAGVGAAMKLGGDRARKKPMRVSVRELAFRGLHVVVTGYALRVYMWLVDGEGLLHPEYASAFVPILVGIGAMLVGLERAAEGKRVGIVLTLAGLGAYAFGLHEVSSILPSRFPSLLKVDVLQSIGACLTLIALLEPVFGAARRPALGALLGCLLILPTDLIAARLPGELPIPIASYLGQWKDPISLSLAAFPIFPWVGYAFIGTTIGNVWLRANDLARADRIVFGFGALAAAVAVVAYGPFMHAHVIPFVPHLPRVLFILYRVGFGLSLLIVVHLFCRVTGRAPLRELGKTSMVIYWVHLEFAYGLAAKPFHHRLGYLEWCVGFVLLTLAMALVAHLRLEGPRYLRTLRETRPAAGAGTS